MAEQNAQYVKMTETPVSKLVIRLGIPTTLSMLVTNIYNLADTAFVGQLNTSASGAVGIVFGFMAILQAVGFLFGSGAGSILSRKLGSRDVEGASATASTAFFGSLGCGVILALLCFLFLDPLIYVLGSTDTIFPYAKDYLTAILVAAPFMVSSFTLNNLLRYEGRASLAMIGLMTGSILNIAADPILMFRCNLGILGAGVATAGSQIISFCILLSMFLRGKTQTKLSVRRISHRLGDWWNIITTGLPSLLRQGLNSLATVVLNSQAAVYGDAAVAAMSIVSRVVMFIFAVGLGIGQGYQPVCAFNYGAKKYRRVKQAFRFTFAAGECVLGLFALVGLLVAPGVIQIFRDDPEVIAMGTRALQLRCWTLFLLPLGVVTEMTMQSSGKRLAAATLSSLKSGVFFIPAILILAQLRGLSGIQEAQPVSDLMAFLSSIPFAIHYFKKLPEEPEEKSA
jgi:putative MATE family efflux protein